MNFIFGLFTGFIITWLVKHLQMKKQLNQIIDNLLSKTPEEKCGYPDCMCKINYYDFHLDRKDRFGREFDRTIDCMWNLTGWTEDDTLLNHLN